MNEIMEIADSISILRDGKIVHTGKIADITMEEIIAHMMGENTGKKFDWVPRKYDKDGDDLLRVEHLKINDRINDISFSLKKARSWDLPDLWEAGVRKFWKHCLDYGRRKEAQCCATAAL